MYLEGFLVRVGFMKCRDEKTDSRETTSPMADRCLVGFLAVALGVV